MESVDEERIGNMSERAQELITFFYKSKKMYQENIESCNKNIDELLDVLQQLQELQR